MAKYRITDNQSGKTLVINGATEPSEQEAEQLFQQSGIRDNAPSAQPQAQAPQQTDAFSNPIANFLLKNAGNVSKDIGAGLASVLNPGLKESQNANFKNIDMLMQKAQTTTDPEQKQALMKLAQQITSTISQTSQQEQSSYSPQVQEGIAGRSLKTGAEVAATAEIPSLVKGGFNLAKGGVNLIKKGGPIAVKGEARNIAAQQANKGSASGSKIAKAGEKYLSNDPLAKSYAEKVGMPLKDKAFDAVNLLEKIKVWNNAYTSAGKVGKSSKAGYYNALARAGKEEMKRIAPEVTKLTGDLRFLYKAPKDVRKIIFAMSTAAGGVAFMKYLLSGGKK